MKFVTSRPYAEPEAAMRKLLKIANTVEPIQDGRIHIEKIQLADAIRAQGIPSGIQGRAPSRDRTRSALAARKRNPYVKFTQKGAELFA